MLMLSPRLRQNKLPCVGRDRDGNGKRARGKRKRRRN